MIDNRTAILQYLLPDPENLMRTEDVPRLVTSLQMLDADIAAILANMLNLAPLNHGHPIEAISGLASALSGKSPTGHSHGIGTLGGVDLANAAAGQLMGFSGTIWIPVTLTAAHLADKIISNSKLRNSDPFSVIGRAVSTAGSPGDIAAAANDRLLGRVADALGFVQVTPGMIPDGVIPLAKVLAADTLKYGARVEAKDLGNLAGASLSLDPGDRPIQIAKNNGAGGLLPSANPGTFLLVVTNAAGAASITTTGWVVKGDSFDLTVGSKFLCSCLIVAGTAVMNIMKVT